MKWIVKAALLGCMLLGWQNVAAAQVYRTEIHGVVAPTEMELDEVRIVGSDVPLLATIAQSPRSVRLQGEVTVGSLASIKTLKEGEILFGRYDDRSWTYCTIDRANPGAEAVSQLLMTVLTAGTNLLLGPPQNMYCLHDGDGDGDFENAYMRSQGNAKEAFVAYAIAPTSISAPVPYERVPLEEGPAMIMRVDWSKKSRSAVIELKTTMGGLAVNTQSVSVPAPGAVTESINILGANVQILAYDSAQDTLEYKVTRNSSESYLRIPATLTIRNY